MANRHTIGQAVFDISFDSRTAAIEQEAELGSYIRERLLPLADDIFNELAADGTVSKIDHLEIDLGDIAYADFQDEMADRFRDRLRSVLADKVEALAVAPGAHEFTLTPRQAELKQLWDFLATGRWQAVPPSAAEFEHMLSRILDSSGEELVLQLRKSPNSEIAVRRMIRQFPQEMLSRMIRQITPVHAAALERLAASFAGKRHSKQPDVDTEEVLVRIWERLFTRLLQDGSKIQDIRQFFGSNMRQLFPATAAAASDSRRAADAVAGGHGGTVEASLAAGDESGEEPDAPSPLRLLAARLESALVRGDAALLAEDWNELCREHAELLREIFVRRFGDAGASARLASGFDEQMLLDLVQLLVPQHLNDISALAQQVRKQEPEAYGGQAGPEFWGAVLDTVHAQMTGRIEPGSFADELAEHFSAQGMQVKGETLSSIGLLRARLESALSRGDTAGLAEEWTELRREHAELLREVFVGRLGDTEARRKLASGFDDQMLLDLVQLLVPQHPNYISTLAEQVRKPASAAHDGQAGSEFWCTVLDTLHALMTSGIEAGSFAGELAYRLSAQGMQIDGELQPVEHESAAAGTEPVADTAHLDDDPVQELLQRLRHGNTTVRTIAELDQLARSNPIAYRHLLQQLQAGPIVLERLGLDELRQLVYGLARQNGAEPGDDFEQEMARQAQAAADQAVYYRHILQQFLGKQPVTFEQMAELLPPQARIQADKARQEEGPLSPIGLLRARLEAALVAGQARAIAEEWQELCSAHAELVREIFMSHAGDTSVRRRLARGFPQHMLFDLVRLFVPQQIDFIASLVEELERHIMATHGEDAELVVRRLCWEYTLEYLQGETATIEQMEYVSGLVRRLSTIDPAEFSIPAAVSESGMQAKEITEQAGLLSRDSMPSEDTGIDVSYQQILQRLQANDHPVGIGNAVRKLVDSRPDLFERLLMQLRTKAALAAKLERLEAWDLKQFVAGIVSLSAAGEDGGFYAEIEKHVQWAQDEKAYYLHILKRLLHNLLVDLELAMAETARPGSMAQDDALRHEAAAVQNEAAASGLEQALLDEDTVMVADAWSTLRQQPARLRETCLRLIGRQQTVAKLAGMFSEAMLLELVAAVMPDAARLIALLLRLPELRNSDRVTFWRYTLTYLHATKTGDFEVGSFVSGWQEIPEGQDVEAHHESGGAATENAHETSEEDVYAQRLVSLEEGVAPHGAQQTIVETARQQAAELSEQDIQELMAALLPSAAADFLRESAQYALQAENRLRYYHDLLQQILHGRPVDFEQAVQTSAGDGKGRKAVRHAAERWETFEAALQAGNEAAIVAAWVALRLGPAGPLQQALRSRLENSGLREMLAGQTPDFIWPELLGLIAPEMSEFVGILRERLKSQGAGAGITGNNAPVHKALRRYSLDYLVASSGRFDRHSYAQGLSSHLAGLGLSHLLQAATDDNEIVEAPAVPLDMQASRHESATLPDSLPQPPGREAEQFDMLVSRLSGRSSGEISQQLSELAAEHPATLRKLLHELQAGRLQLRAEMLSARETAQLVSVFIELNMGTAGAELQRGMTELAGQARNEKAFYRHILRSLIDNLNIDLEAAQREAEQELHTGDAYVKSAQMDVLKLRARLDSALAHGDVAGLAAEWAELLREHAELLREIFVGRLGDAGTRSKLAAGFDDPMLFDLVQLLAPQHHSHIYALSKQIGRHASAAHSGRAGPEFWRAVLDILHALISGRIEPGSFAGELAERLSEKGMQVDGLLLAIEHDGIESGKEHIEDHEYTKDASVQELLQHLRHGKTTARTSTELNQLAHSGPIALERFGLDELRQLVHGLARQNGAEPGGDFEQEIAGQAQAAADQAAYYRYILQQLLGNQPVDLEQATNLTSRPERKSSEEKQMDRSNDTAVLSRDGRKGAEEDSIPEAIYIANAGLVLAASYLPHLFGMLGLTGESGFKDDAAAERAVHLSQVVVNESSDSPEFLLVLNKILCGVPIKLPIVREIHCSEQECAAVEEMLRAIIANWKVLGNTSPEGLRRSFLERAGRLSLKADGWHLEVEHGAIDVLLDQLPWSFAVIKYSWMPQPLYVEWR